MGHSLPVTFDKNEKGRSVVSLRNNDETARIADKSTEEIWAQMEGSRNQVSQRPKEGTGIHSLLII